MVSRDKWIRFRTVLINKTENKPALKLVIAVEMLKGETGNFFQHFKSRENIKILLDLIGSIIKGAKRIERMLKVVEKGAKNT